MGSTVTMMRNDPPIPLTSFVDETSLMEAEMRAGLSRDPSGTLLNFLIDLVFTPSDTGPLQES